MEDNAIELNIVISRDEEGYGFAVTALSTFVVSEISESGAAERAGLRVNDIIRQINGQIAAVDENTMQQLHNASSQLELVIARRLQSQADASICVVDEDDGASGLAPVGNEQGDDVSLTNRIAECSSYSSGVESYSMSSSDVINSETDTSILQSNIPEEETETEMQTETETDMEYSTKERPRLMLEGLASHEEQQISVEPGLRDVVSDDPSITLAVTDAPENTELATNWVLGEQRLVKRLSHSEIARLNALSQMTHSDDDSEEQPLTPLNPNTVFWQTQIQVPVQSPPAVRDVRASHEQCAAFSDWVRLRERPGHLAILLGYALQNADVDVTPLIVALVCDVYRSSSDCSSLKDTKRWLLEIYAAFIAERAPLRLVVEDSVLRNLESAIQSSKAEKDKDESLRHALHAVAVSAREQASLLLQDFVGVLARGLGTLYEVQDVVGCESFSKNDELRLFEAKMDSRIARLLEHLTKSCDALAIVASSAALGDLQRTAVLLQALLCIAKAYGVQNGNMQIAAERYVPFCTKSKRISLKRFVPPNSRVSASGLHTHQYFILQFAGPPFRYGLPASHASYASCTLCGLALWTVGVQGFQCACCDVTVHCDCARFIVESCPKSSTANTAASALPLSPTASTATLREREKDSKRPRSVNVITALPSIIRKINLPGGATLSREAKKHAAVAQTCLAGDEPATSTTSSTAASSALIDTSPPVRNDPLDEDVFAMIDARLSADADRNTSHKRSCSDMPVRAPKPSDTRKLAERDAKQRSASTIARPTPEEDCPGPDAAPLRPSRLPVSLSFISTPDAEFDFELDSDRPLETLLDRDVYDSLKKRERERQQAIHELITTELSHVRWTFILQRLFYAAWPPEFTELRDLLLPNVADVLELHRAFAHALRETRDPRTQLVARCGPLLDSWFGDERMADWTAVAARFCAMHFLGIERLRKLRHKEAALDRALSAAEADPLCRRKQLTDLLACEMQRVTKYALLLERVLKPTAALAAEGDAAMLAEAETLHSAVASARRIASAVDAAVRERQNAYMLAELVRRIDDRMSPSDTYYATTIGSLDTLARRRMLFEGALKWHISKQRTVDVRCLLLESVLLLLQVADDKLVLKVHSAAPAADRLDRFICSPLVPLQHVHVREDAGDKRLFYVLNRDKGHSVMYDLVAPSHDERKKWIMYITEAAEAVKQQQGAVTLVATQSCLVPNRKIGHNLRGEAHSDAPVSLGSRLGRTATVSVADTQTKLMPVVGPTVISKSSEPSPDVENYPNIKADAAQHPEHAEVNGATEESTAADGETPDSPGSGDSSRNRMSSLRATLRKHNRRGFDDTFLENFVPTVPNEASGTAAERTISIDCSTTRSEEEQLQLARSRAIGRRRSSLSVTGLDLHVCNASCSSDADGVTHSIAEHQESVHAEGESAHNPAANGPCPRLRVAGADTSRQNSTTEATRDGLGHATGSAATNESATRQSDTEIEGDRARLKKNDSDAESNTLTGEPDTSDALSSSSSLIAPTRVSRKVSRDVHTETHVLRVDEAERIAKEIAKQDRSAIDSLSERQKLFTAFLVLQRNLLRVTNLNAEAQRARLHALQAASGGNPQTAPSGSADDQRSRAVAMRTLIEGALKQAKSVLEFMTTYQPTDQAQASGPAVSTSPNGLGLYSTMPLNEALRIVEGVNQSLVDLVGLLDGTKRQLETNKLTDVLVRPTVEANAPQAAPVPAPKNAEATPIVALSLRNVLLDRTMRTVTHREPQPKPPVVVETPPTGREKTPISASASYFEAVSRMDPRAIERREKVLVCERANMVVSHAPNTSGLIARNEGQS